MCEDIFVGHGLHVLGPSSDRLGFEVEGFHGVADIGLVSLVEAPDLGDDEIDGVQNPQVDLLELISGLWCLSPVEVVSREAGGEDVSTLTI